MNRYEIIRIPPEKEMFIVIDHALDGYVIGNCASAKEAEEFKMLREGQDAVHSC